MAMLHTPHNRSSKDPKNRLLMENAEQNTNSSMKHSTPLNKMTTPAQSPTESLDGILAEISRTVRESVSLLNQTRNMRSDLRNGLADNLTKMSKHVGTVALLSRKKLGNRSDATEIEIKSTEVQCNIKIDEGQQEQQSSIRKYILEGFEIMERRMNEMMNEKVMDLKEYISDSEIRVHESIVSLLDDRLDEVRDENKKLTEEVKTKMSEMQETIIKECKGTKKEINKRVEAMHKMSREAVEECIGMKGEINDRVSEISKLNKEVVKECQDMKGEIVSKVENVRKISEEMKKESKENINKVVSEWKVRPPDETRPATYARVVSGYSNNLQQEPKGKTLHSLVITDREDIKTGVEIIEEVGKLMNVKEEGIKVDRIRKAKGRKVIVGFSDKNERDRMKSKIEKSEGFEVEVVQNKDPLVVLYGVYKTIDDENLIDAIKKQNNHLMQQNTEGEESRMKVKYRRKGKDEQTEHVVLTVSPGLWQCFTQAGHLYVDLQRVRVADQSPLIQCSNCLGYGHGKRHCNNGEGVKCSHCTGSHHQSQCESQKKGEKPSCINCSKENHEGNKDHNAFDMECPVRQRWDALARATVAYVPENA